MTIPPESSLNPNYNTTYRVQIKAKMYQGAPRQSPLKRARPHDLCCLWRTGATSYVQLVVAAYQFLSGILTPHSPAL